MNKIRFSIENGQIVEKNVRFIKQSDMQARPHCIMMPSHYRENGSCLCNDKNAIVMKEWR